MAQDAPQTDWVAWAARTYSLSLSTLDSTKATSRGIVDSLSTHITDYPDDCCLVAFGSVARDEHGGAGDLDWAILDDGPADPAHADLPHEVAQKIDELGIAKPGGTGTFGCLISGHDLIHHIGGIDDTNQNLTRRILLLLESVPINNSNVHARIIDSLLSRYIVLDPAISWKERGEASVPRFLLNDMIRYWRTITVDYSSKKLEAPDGWALRNAKLRLSRKLIYTKGLLMCLYVEFASNTLFPDPDAPRDLDAISKAVRTLSGMPPIQLLARALYDTDSSRKTARPLLESYDKFLQIINNEATRTHLKSLSPSQHDDADFRRLRTLAKEFQSGLYRLFYVEDAALTRLVRHYGLF